MGVGLEQYWQQMIHGRGGWPAALLQRLLLPLSWLYGAGAMAARGPYDLGLRRQTQPALPVISIGNLALGGTGKTTVTAHLAARLRKAGGRPALVLRGYRGDPGPEPLVLDSSSPKELLDQAGDEALLLAQRCPGVPVLVARQREAAVARAAEMGATVALLDDGFQYFRMARNLDLLLFNALHYPHALKLFPAGSLREPLAYLARADHVWITYAQAVSADRLEAVIALCRRLAPEASLVVTSHRISRCHLIQSEETVDPAGRRVLAFCGLGSPEGFEASLRQLKPVEVVMRAFPDHHKFSASELASLAEEAQRRGAEVVLTTAKDAVRLPTQAWPCQAPPLVVAEVELDLLEGVEYVEEVVSRWAR